MKKIASLLTFSSNDILSAGFIIMCLTALSGILGIVRSRLLVSTFTDDLVAIYFASFVIPDNVFQVVILGALGSAFIPVFSKYQNSKGKWEFALSFMHASLGAFLLCVIVAFVFIKPFSSLLVPGLEKENPAHLALLINLTRTILVAQLFFVVSYLFTGILQSHQRFLIPALAPVFYNAGIILGILFLVPYFGMYGVALGVLLGAFLHFLIQLPFVSELGFRYRPYFNLSHKGIQDILHLMGPRTISIVLERAKVTIDTMLASLISLNSIAFLNLAVQIAVFPVSFFAAAIGQAAFPFLAKAARKDDLSSFKEHISVALTHIIFFLAPTTVLLVVLHTPLVRLSFGSKYFSWEATFLTSWTLVFLALGMLFQGIGGLLARGFFALYDTKTPLVVTFFALLTTVVLSVVFVSLLHLPVWSLGIATTIGSVVNAVTLFVLLDRRVKGFNHFTLFISFTKILMISLFLTIFSYAAFKFFEQFFDTNYTGPLLGFTFLISILSLGFYILLSFVFNLEEYQELKRFLQKVRRAPEILRQRQITASESTKVNP